MKNERYSIFSLFHCTALVPDAVAWHREPDAPSALCMPYKQPFQQCELQKSLNELQFYTSEFKFIASELAISAPCLTWWPILSTRRSILLTRSMVLLTRILLLLTRLAILAAGAGKTAAGSGIFQACLLPHFPLPFDGIVWLSSNATQYNRPPAEGVRWNAVQLRSSGKNGGAWLPHFVSNTKKNNITNPLNPSAYAI